ncbi:MAG: DUF1573 domain-containing protein [Chloroflexi bacterium]|nr:DUF1573 domain-containing protein [Chloroflexota bacterium]
MRKRNTTGRTASRRIKGYRGILFALAAAFAVLVGLTACDLGSGSGGPGGQGQTAGSGPKLSFQETEHQFGTISYATPMEYRFQFTNAGDQPLQITDVNPEPPRPGGT